jgi:hypothetical protein
MTAVDLIAQTLGAHRANYSDKRCLACDAPLPTPAALAAHQAQAVTEALGLVEETREALRLMLATAPERAVIVVPTATLRAALGIEVPDA